MLGKRDDETVGYYVGYLMAVVYWPSCQMVFVLSTLVSRVCFTKYLVISDSLWVKACHKNEWKK